MENNLAHAAVQIVSSANEMRQSEFLCDFIIKAGSSSFPVHRLILATRSDYFRAMFSHEMKETQQGYVEIKDMEPDAIKQCIDFMYTNSASITVKNAQDILRAGHLMQLEEITKQCFDILKYNINVENCIMIKSLAFLFLSTETEETADKIILKNFSKLAKNDMFANIGESEVIKYLEMSSDNPNKAWSVLETWVKFNTDDRQKCLTALFQHLVLEKFDNRFLQGTVWKSQLIYNSQFCKTVIAEVIHKRINDGSFEISTRNCFFVRETVTAERCGEISFEVESFLVKNIHKLYDTKKFRTLSTSEIHKILYEHLNGNLDHDNCLTILCLSKTHSFAEIQAVAAKFVVQNFENLTAGQLLNELSYSDIIHCLNYSIDIAAGWGFLKTWTECNLTQRQPMFLKAFDCLELQKYSEETLHEIISSLEFMEQMTLQDKVIQVLCDRVEEGSISINQDNFFFFAKLMRTRYLRCTDVLQVLLDDFMKNNFSYSMFTNPNFKNLHSKDLLRLIKFAKYDLETMCSAILEWVKDDVVGRKAFLHDLLKQIMQTNRRKNLSGYECLEILSAYRLLLGSHVVTKVEAVRNLVIKEVNRSYLHGDIVLDEFTCLQYKLISGFIPSIQYAVDKIIAEHKFGVFHSMFMMEIKVDAMIQLIKSLSRFPENFIWQAIKHWWTRNHDPEGFEILLTHVRLNRFHSAFLSKIAIEMSAESYFVFLDRIKNAIPANFSVAKSFVAFLDKDTNMLLGYSVRERDWIVVDDLPDDISTFLIDSDASLFVFSLSTELHVIAGNMFFRLSGDHITVNWHRLQDLPDRHVSNNTLQAVVLRNTLYIIQPNLRGRRYFTLASAYDQDFDTWRKIASPVRTKFSHTVVAVQTENYIYCVGGNYYGKPSNAVDAYSADAGNWMRVSNMIFARSKPAATVLHDRIFVFGGIGVDGNLLNDFEVYNVVNNCWVNVIDLPFNLYDATFTACSLRGKLFLVGGSKNVETYMLKRGRKFKWSQVPVLSELSNLSMVGVVHHAY